MTGRNSQRGHVKLATFLHDDTERWGFLVHDPVTGMDRLVEPGRAEAALAANILGTSGYSASRPMFRGDEWPDELVDFLALGDAGMADLSRLAVFLERYLSQSDATVIDLASYNLEDVELLAPIPRPRLCWGLVTNAPSFVRNNSGVQHINLFPLGHQRPQGSVVGDGASVLMKNRHHVPLMSYNVELGIIIGTGGRYIASEDAMQHVAGFTTITDIAGTYYYGAVPGNQDRGYQLPSGYDDWLYQATASWGGKIADTMCPVGPYLVTKDEVGDPYDLLVYTRQDGRTRNRAHTAATMLGIERVIQWYSSFATLHAGDIIHFGTMGVDGLPIASEIIERGSTTLESEIEDVGILRNPVRVVPSGDTVAFDEHPSYAVRTAAQESPLTGARWRVEESRHFYTAFGNHEGASDDGLPRLEVPRFLAGPASSLGMSGSQIELPPRATELEIGIELAVVIKSLAADVSSEGASEVVLALCPLISVCDLSFRDAAIEPARPGERHIPAVYGRWADSFNIVPERIDEVSHSWRDRTMNLRVGDVEISGSTSDYIAGPDDLIATISAMSTLFPGDVITLGSTRATIRVDRGRSIHLTGGIEGLGEVRADLAPAQI